MEKRTILAVVLSVVVISGSYVIQGWLAPPPKKGATAVQTEQSSQTPAPTASTISSSPAPSGTGTTGTNTAETAPNTVPAGSLIPADTTAKTEEKINIETNLVKAVFSTQGGDIVSYKLKEHRDHNDFLEMVLPGNTESHAFTIAFGGLDAKPITDIFNYNRVSDTVIEFYKDYTVAGDKGPQTFRLTKRYELKPKDYMFELSVTLDGGTTVPPLNFNGSSYTLEFGPQIGPKFKSLSEQYEYRNYYTYANGKQKQEKVSNKGPTIINTQVSWAAIAGKYFTFIAIPDATKYEYAFASNPVPGIPTSSQFFMVRPTIMGSKTTDVYRFYLGPKTQKALSVYDFSDKNAFKMRDMNMTSVANTSGILAPLEVALKWLLLVFYNIIPNYGIAIILLTIFVKLILFPLTKKGSESTLRMQSISPKIKEIQTKYKDNPTKMNAEMAELYKKEGYNPMSGCLPMLLQIPIFFAMYNLFNNHFDLRGALFIPGWIPDLSLPETIWNFSPFKIPLLNWSDLRLLPFIYLVSQLLYGKVTQTPDQQGNSQMKMMLYAMPIMFFFILYNVPSGLLLYWIMSNLLTLVQQLIINEYLAQKKKHMPASEPVIAPKRKRK